MKKVKTNSSIVGSTAPASADARDASSEPKEVVAKNIKVKAGIKAGPGGLTDGLNGGLLGGLL